VYLQTLRPDHALLNTLVNENYRAFAKQTLSERQIAQMPPFRYAVLIRCESKDQAQNTEFLQKHAALLRQYSDLVLDIWGPIPAPMERKAGRYQSHMVLLSADRARLHYYVRSWLQNLLQDKPSSLKLTLDIDPQELS
jgi:primosomal protein N' (replication factor Y)